MCADLRELLDYLSHAAVLALVPLLTPQKDRRLRRLAWMPILCVGVWSGLVVILYLSRASLGESYGWIIYSALVSIVFAILAGAAFLVWSIRGMWLSAESRWTLAPYLGYACCVAGIGSYILILDRWHGRLARVMIGCAVVGLVVKGIAWSMSRDPETSTGPTD